MHAQPGTIPSDETHPPPSSTVSPYSNSRAVESWSRDQMEMLKERQPELVKELEGMSIGHDTQLYQLERNALKFQPDLPRERIARDITELIGWTPLVEVNHITKSEGAAARIVVKLEGQQPFCSVKDRIALHMVECAEREKLITPGVSTLLEMTSGNTGISLAAVGLLKGYKVLVVMPGSYSFERRMLIRAFGAELILLDPVKGFAGLVDKVMELQNTIPNSYWINQPSNLKNSEAHFLSTGPEIWKDTAGKVDIFISGVGTGGSSCGTGKYLKSMNPNIKVIAVEPTESAVLSGGQPGCHMIQGMGPGFIPAVTDPSIFDEVVPSSTDEAIQYAQRLAREEAMLVGVSSGAVFSSALKVAKRPENKGKLIVALLASAGERYLSSAMFDTIREDCTKMKIES